MFSQAVPEDRFFGHRDLLGLLQKRVQALADGYRQNLALLGPPLVGKTSIICRALAAVPSHAVLPLYIEVRRESFPEFAQRFLAAGIAQALGTAPSQPSHDTLELLLRDAAGRLPHTTEEAQRLRTWVEKGRHTEAFGGLFDWLQTMSQETGRPVLVVLDEFHGLVEFEIRHALAELGKRMMVEKRVMYLMASSQPAVARQMLQEQLHLLFGHFEIIDVAPFDPATSQAFLRERLAGLAVPASIAAFLASWTGGQPFYLDYFCRSLAQTARAEGLSAITPETLYTVALQLLGDSHGAFHRRWQEPLETLGGTQHTTALATLVALAHSRLTVRELSHRCQRSPQETNRIANRLADLHLVTRRGNCLAIDDPLFRFWLLAVHEPLRWSPAPNCGVLARRFVLDVEAAFLRHQREQERPPVDRLIELFHCFQDDRVQIDQKLRQLPRFIDVHQNGTHVPGAHIYARTRQHQWVCCVTTDRPATEGDIAAFHQVCQALAPKPQRKIFVALEGLDPNATLLAKEARMWTWDRQTVNALLGLYGKQPIAP